MNLWVLLMLLVGCGTHVEAAPAKADVPSCRLAGGFAGDHYSFHFLVRVSEEDWLALCAQHQSVEMCRVNKESLCKR